MDFLFIKKDKIKHKDILIDYSASFEVFNKRGQENRMVFDDDKFYLAVYDSLNSKCFIKKYPNGNFIITLGTLFYKEKYGSDCLHPLFNDFLKKDEDLLNNLIGNYCVIIYLKNELFFFNDYLGLLRVFSTNNYKIISSSFLAITKAIRIKTPSSQEIFEYLIRGGMYGGNTIVKEIKLIPNSTIICALEGGNDKKMEYKYNRPSFYNDFDKMSNHVSGKLLDIFNVITKNFKTNITTALSGGYDSRLIVAILKRNNITPHLYVYGSVNSSDVVVAKNICKRENFKIEHIDKNKFDKIKISDYAEVVEKNFYQLDGLGNIGIFDNDTDVLTRKHRSLGGKLQLNGGGGEIFRNYWQLNPFGKKSLNFIRHKYDVFEYNAYSSLFNKKEFFNAFTQKMEESAGVKSGSLSRREMEMCYPLFRLKYWQAMNNSINIRFSNTITPLIDPSLLFLSYDIPIHYKFNGKFEASLIKKIDYPLATYTSNYGHNFKGNVPINKKIKSLIKRNIPLIIKPFIRYKLSQKNIGKTPYFFEENYINQVVDLNNMFISKYIDIRKVKDSKVLSRALTLEYYFNHI